MADNYSEVSLSGLNETQLGNLVLWAKSTNIKSITSNGVSAWLVETVNSSGTAIIHLGGPTASTSKDTIKTSVDTLLGTNATTRVLTRAQSKIRTIADVGR